jgi:hypothetical protein
MTDKTEAYKKKWRHASKVGSSSDDAEETVVLSETKDQIENDMNLTLSLDFERGVRNARVTRPTVS